jgi:hypothetical protein
MERGRHVWIENGHYRFGFEHRHTLYRIVNIFDSVLVFTAHALRRHRALSVESLTDGRPSTLLVFTSPTPPLPYILMMRNCVNLSGWTLTGLYAMSSSFYPQSSSGSVLVILGVRLRWLLIEFTSRPCSVFVLFFSTCCCSLTRLWALSLYHVTICYCAPPAVHRSVSRLTSPFCSSDYLGNMILCIPNAFERSKCVLD